MPQGICAQAKATPLTLAPNDSMSLHADSTTAHDAYSGISDSLMRYNEALDSAALNATWAPDTLKRTKQKRDWATWRPNPKRAMWLAIVIPGAGQIYNRKYWKLPIVYGGFIGCMYAMRWNNQMYNDYSRPEHLLHDRGLCLVHHRCLCGCVAL